MPKQELEYIILVINDYLNSLPISSRVAVGERVQACIANVEKALAEATTPAPETPAASE